MSFYLQYSSRRFTGLTEEDTRDMHEYILNITLAKGSGEYCICKPSVCSLSHFSKFNHFSSAYPGPRSTRTNAHSRSNISPQNPRNICLYVPSH